uniref:GOLD domain-containing protein n=1 Tax=Plectus sambesii TaxID=2011161 RepID=A0A914X5Q0_9BILA
MARQLKTLGPNVLRCIALLFTLSLVNASEFDFTVEVAAGKFQCYFQNIENEKFKTLEIDYQVIDGGDLNVNFMLLFGGDILAQDKMKTDGSHRVEIKTLGDYQICFDNTFSYQTRKVVFFEIFLFDKDGNLDDLDVAKLANQDSTLNAQMEAFGVTIGEFHSTSNRIKGSLNKMEYYQALMRAWEARDRAIMSANLDRVTFWSFFNGAVLLGVGLVQVYMIRSLFEDQSKIGRMLRR